MFSKGNKSTTPPAPSPVAPPPPPSPTANLTGGGTQPVPAPGSASKPRAGGDVPSIISADVKIIGNVQSNGDIQIDGTVEGDIFSRTLTVGEGAQVKGSIRGETVRICGAVQGEVQAASVIIAKTAKVSGDVVHQSLAIEAGAYLEGNIRRMEPNRAGAGASAPVMRPGEQPSPSGNSAAGPAKTA